MAVEDILKEARYKMKRAGEVTREEFAATIGKRIRGAREATKLGQAAAAQHGAVARVEVDPVAAAEEERFTRVKHWAGVPAEANVELVQAPRLWQLGFAGQGVTVATMDSGADVNHPDLGPRWRGGSNSWFDPNGEHPDAPVDLDGHGSGVLGVLVGGDAGGTAIGVAPGARWVAVKVFNDAGVAPFSALHQGYGWLLDPDGNPATDDAPDVVNNSWGFEDNPGVCDTLAREFQPDLQALAAAAAFLIRMVAATSSSVARRPLIGKFSTARAVWMPK